MQFGSLVMSGFLSLFLGHSSSLIIAPAFGVYLWCSTQGIIKIKARKTNRWMIVLHKNYCFYKRSGDKGTVFNFINDNTGDFLLVLQWLKFPITIFSTVWNPEAQGSPYWKLEFSIYRETGRPVWEILRQCLLGMEWLWVNGKLLGTGSRMKVCVGKWV